MRAVIADPNNTLYLSSASTWELVIKSRLGKIALPEPPGVFLEKQLRTNVVDPLPITIAHTIGLVSLPNLHKDPFDRILVAQAIHEDLTLITDDAWIRQYDVKTMA